MPAAAQETAPVLEKIHEKRWEFTIVKYGNLRWEYPGKFYEFQNMWESVGINLRRFMAKTWESIWTIVLVVLVSFVDLQNITNM